MHTCSIAFLSFLITKVIQYHQLTFALPEFSSVMQRRVATASPKHHLRSTSAQTFVAFACQRVVNLPPPEERESNTVRANCQQCQRSETDVLWLWSTVLLTVSFTVLFLFLSLQTVMRWSVADAPLCCASTSFLVPPLSLVRFFSIFVSLSHSLRRFCSVAPCSDWSVVMGLTLSSPESGDALFCFLVVLSIQLFPLSCDGSAVSARLHLPVPVEMLWVLFKYCVRVACFHSYLMLCSVMKMDMCLLGKGHKKNVALFQT